MPMSLPAKHAIAGDAESSERLANEVRDDAQVLGNDLGSGVTENTQDALAECGLLRLPGRHEYAVAPAKRAHKHSIKAHQVIDSIAVEEISVAPCPLHEPIEIALGKHVPSVGGKSPVLTRCAERIRRHTNRERRIEFVLSCPDIRAITADGKREIAIQGHTARAPACRGPLFSCDPLYVLAVAHLLVELDYRVG